MAGIDFYMCALHLDLGFGHERQGKVTVAQALNWACRKQTIEQKAAMQWYC